MELGLLSLFDAYESKRVLDFSIPTISGECVQLKIKCIDGDRNDSIRSIFMASSFRTRKVPLCSNTKYYS